MKMKCLIISGGSIDDDFLVEVVKNGGYDVLLAADSGMDALYRNKILPELIVGDMDSVSGEAWEFFKEHEKIEIIQLNPRKDETDTEFALREAIRRGAHNITILGGTGGRIDHTFSNIALLGIGLENYVSVELLDANNRVRLLEHEVTISWTQQFGSYVSLIPYGGPVRGITVTGMKYPLENAELDIFKSLGISNEIIEDEAKITWEEGYLLIIETKDEKNSN
jgi:thiamine pyrophosphokinase